MTKPDLILHPVRMRVIIALTNRTLTPKQLAAELNDVALATLYHHLNLLTDAGITRVVEERLVRGTLREKVYTVTDASAILTPEDLAGAPKGELLQYFLVFVSKLIGDYARYLDRNEDGRYTDAGYQQHPVFLSDEEFAQFVQEFNAALVPWLKKEPAPGRNLRLLTTILITEREAEKRNDDDT
jgi:DNA-binding transcriptional ArsR family regulator